MNAINWIAYLGVTRTTKQAPWWQKAIAAVVASTTAGALAGAGLGAFGAAASDTVRGGLVGALAPFGVALVIGGWTAGVKLLPQLDRETEQRLVHHGPLRWAAENGALLGLGFTSRLGTWLWYTVPAAALASGSPREGAMVYGLYGFTRLFVPSVFAGISVRRMTIDVAATVLPWRPEAIRLADIVFVFVAVGAFAAAL